MRAVRPDPLGILDVVSGIMLFYTISPVPVLFAQVHAGFLIFKGAGSMIEPLHLPVPVYILGGAADLISAAILATGNPPVLAGFKIWISGFLFLKGLWSLIAFMGN